jgi:hypothetical protein
MNDNTGFWAAVWQVIATSSVIGLAMWGAAGGATSGLLIRVKPIDLIRHIVIGALVAGGVGALALPLVVWALNLPVESISLQIGGLAGSGAYLAGVILPGIFEVLLTRIKRGVLPNDREDGK